MELSSPDFQSSVLTALFFFCHFPLLTGGILEGENLLSNSEIKLITPGKVQNLT